MLVNQPAPNPSYILPRDPPRPAQVRLEPPLASSLAISFPCTTACPHGRRSEGETGEWSGWPVTTSGTHKSAASRISARAISFQFQYTIHFSSVDKKGNPPKLERYPCRMCNIFISIWKRVAQEVITLSWLWYVTQSVAHMCSQCSTKFTDSLIWNWVRVELLCELAETNVEAIFRILVSRLLHQLTISLTKYEGALKSSRPNNEKTNL